MSDTETPDTVFAGGVEWTAADADTMPIGFELAVKTAAAQALEEVAS